MKPFPTRLFLPALLVLFWGCGPATVSDSDAPKADAVVGLKQKTIASLGLGLLEVPAGTFTMGSPVDEPNRDDDEVSHTVKLTKPFWLGKTEVTQGQWEKVMGSNPSEFKGEDLPVEQVSWDDAMAFCRKLTEQERKAGSLPAGYEYTLPTEAQWEVACRAGTTGSFAGELDAMAWYGTNSGGTTHRVGGKEPNFWGFHDMHGNVWEWCADWYGDYPARAVSDPVGPDQGSNRVYRGGSWRGNARYCRSAFRGRLTPEYRYGDLGFRLSLAPVRQ